MNTERSREPVAGENRCKYAFMKITFELQGRNQDSVGCDVFFALGRTVLTANMAGRMRKQVVNELIRSLVLFTKGGAFFYAKIAQRAFGKQLFNQGGINHVSESINEHEFCRP